ncbi:MAG: hypothetical protein KME47_09885 [Nodosilinea sp. WJT8-NPBG4]|jgi:hypothetical protein|nr:hypothetical protein [Nodosilinea sp. WJT8-NPBG4]
MQVTFKHGNSQTVSEIPESDCEDVTLNLIKDKAREIKLSCGVKVSWEIVK